MRFVERETVGGGRHVDIGTATWRGRPLRSSRELPRHWWSRSWQYRGSTYSCWPSMSARDREQLRQQHADGRAAGGGGSMTATCHSYLEACAHSLAGLDTVAQVQRQQHQGQDAEPWRGGKAAATGSSSGCRHTQVVAAAAAAAVLAVDNCGRGFCLRQPLAQRHGRCGRLRQGQLCRP